MPPTPAKPDLKRKPHVLFVGQTNSARTQMAEAFGRQLLEDLVEVQSAGMEAGTLDPRTRQVLEKNGFDPAGFRPKALDQSLLDWADLVVTLCADAQQVTLQVQNSFVHKNWPVEDPALLASGPNDISPYMQACDDIKRRVRQFSNSIRLMHR